MTDEESYANFEKFFLAWLLGRKIVAEDGRAVLFLTRQGRQVMSITFQNDCDFLIVSVLDGALRVTKDWYWRRESGLYAEQSYY